MRSTIDRILLGMVAASTFGLAVRLWEQPTRTDALDARVEALEHSLRQPAYVAQVVNEQRVAASVVQALEPRLDQLAARTAPPAGGSPLAHAAPAEKPERAEPAPEQVAAAHDGGALVDAAIARGRMEETEAAQLRGQLRALDGTPEGQALLARVFAAMNQGKLKVDVRDGRLPFL